MGTVMADLRARRKGLHFLRGGTMAAVHVARHAQEDDVHFLFHEELLQPFQKGRERLGGNVFQRLGDGLGLIAHRHADAPGTMIQGKNSHGRSVAANRVEASAFPSSQHSNY